MEGVACGISLPAAIALMGFMRMSMIIHTQTASLLGTHNRRVRHWPLCRPSDTIIQAPLVGIVPAVGIGKK